MGARDHRLTGLDGSELAGLVGQARPRRPVDGPRDSTAWEKLGVRRVHDGVDALLSSDVAQQALHRHPVDGALQGQASPLVIRSAASSTSARISLSESLCPQICHSGTEPPRSR